MDKKVVTVDEMNKAVSAGIAAADKRNREAAEAREFVRPYVGDLPMAMDSAEKVLRSAANILNIENAETIHASALKTIIKACARPAGARGSDGSDDMANDSASSGGASFEDFFPDAGRIKAVV